jgi:hypothetical protein
MREMSERVPAGAADRVGNQTKLNANEVTAKN